MDWCFEGINADQIGQTVAKVAPIPTRHVVSLKSPVCLTYGVSKYI